MTDGEILGAWSGPGWAFLRSRPALALAGLLLVVAAGEATLALAPSLGTWILVASPTALRLGLAGLAVVGTAASLLVGVARGTVHPVAALLGVCLAVVYGVTGLVLPWNQLSWAVFTAVRDLPAVGPPLAAVLFGGADASRAMLRGTWVRHAGLTAAGVLVAAVVLAARARDALAGNAAPA